MITKIHWDVKLPSRGLADEGTKFETCSGTLIQFISVVTPMRDRYSAVDIIALVEHMGRLVQVKSDRISRVEMLPEPRPRKVAFNEALTAPYGSAA